jgi:O-antigen/teichoic acid export membrane protein
VVSALLLMSILIYLQIKQTGLRFNINQISPILKYGCPLVLSGLAAFALIGADRWIIAAISSESELGLYALGKKLASITLILMQPFCMWWYARRFKQLKQDNGAQKVAHFSSLGIALVMCCASLICIFSPLFINIMINSQFSSAIIYIPWLALFYVVKQTTDLINLGSYLGKTTWNVMSIDMITAGISLGLSYFLSQYFKIPGVIFALIIAQLCRALLFYKSSQKVLTLNYEWKKLILLALLCSSGVFIVFQIDELLNQSIIAGLFSCILCLFLYVSQLANLNKFQNSKTLEQRVATKKGA